MKAFIFWGYLLGLCYLGNNFSTAISKSALRIRGKETNDSIDRLMYEYDCPTQNVVNSWFVLSTVRKLGSCYHPTTYCALPMRNLDATAAVRKIIFRPTRLLGLCSQILAQQWHGNWPERSTSPGTYCKAQRFHCAGKRCCKAF